MQLVTRPGVAIAVSDTLYEAVQFALACAEQSGGGFDPTVGYAMESRGFNREYRTGRIVRTSIDAGPVSYLDVQLDASRKTITLLRPLILDLGAVAKGLAIDMAARELQAFENFSIDAGGDLYLGGHNSQGAPWCIGIRHPRQAETLINCVSVSNCAVCTSGDYERRITDDSEVHHILDPHTGRSANAVASATVIAPTAMLADALSTAAFVLGAEDGVRLLEKMNVDGLLISPELQQHATPRMYSDYQLSEPALLPHT
jgi:thiamine biosynthesis lipoprotein